MNFDELKQAENNRDKIFYRFEEALKDFRLKHSEAAFDINYADTDHLIVTTENILEYTRQIHLELCRYFNVKLIYVNRLNQQSSRGHYLTIEYIYMASDSDEEPIKWDEIRWL